MLEPTAAQLGVRDAEELGLLVLAAAGCGKTEALAMRAAGLLGREQVASPRKLLVATFTNRARDNIRERLRSHVRPGDLRDRVTVQNFHGLAARLYRAHANVVQVDPDRPLPERDWVTDQCKTRGLSYSLTDSVQKALRVAKQEPRDDAAVLAALADDPLALEIEKARQAQDLLTYDDLLRYAELILANEAVADLYRNHFAAVLVDEFQDLTPQQLRIMQGIGYGRTTYAGDLGQGIYGFTGAAPEQVKASIEAQVARSIVLAESHRSSPAVLAMVNTLARVTGGQQVTCARPASWPGDGVAARLSFATAAEEAQTVLATAGQILIEAPGQRVAIIARTKLRRRFADTAAAVATDLASYRWDDPIFDTETAPLLRRALGRVTVQGFEHAKDETAYLHEAAQVGAVQDPDTREFLVDALAWAADLLRDGHTPEAITARVTVGDGDTLLTRPGVHLLTGHVGKGQQFDWVFIIGLEEGCLPDFRAKSPPELAEEMRVLSVMISRGRHGVVLSTAQQVPDRNGRIWWRDPSQFLSPFDGLDECRDRSRLRQWLSSADWKAITNR